MNEIIIKNIITEELFGNRLCESIDQKNKVDSFYNFLILEGILKGEPISVPELRKILREKIVDFEFIKLDNTRRPAKGTTKMTIVPKDKHPKGIRPSSNKVATFYDLNKKDWRCVSVRSKEIVLTKETPDKAEVIIRDKKDETPNEVVLKKKPE